MNVERVRLWWTIRDLKDKSKDVFIEENLAFPSSTLFFGEAED